jgi:hypothetical protein
MKNLIKLFPALVCCVVLAVGLAACGGGGGGDAVIPPSGNSAPVANAGPDQDVSTDSLVMLDGSGSTDDNPADILTYSWWFTTNPGSDILTGADTYNPTFTPDVDGTYVLSLVINDGTVDSAVDSVTITATTGNIAPVANAGPDQVIYFETGASGAILNGTESTDADSDNLTYSWSVVSDSCSSTLSVPTAAEPLVDFLPGYYCSMQYQLIVNDSTVDSAPDTVLITVTAGTVASAGPDQVVDTGSEVTLDGSGSAGVNGPLTYSWAFTDKPAFSALTDTDITGATTSAPTFSPDMHGTYTLQLEVYDNTSCQGCVAGYAVDTVSISVVRSWRTAEIIDAGDRDAGSSEVAIIANGSAFAIWAQRDVEGGSVWSLYANRYDAETSTWGTEEIIDNGAITVSDSHLGVDAEGNAFVIWKQSDNLYVNRYDNQTGAWEGALPMSGSIVYEPHLSVGENGDALAVWKLNNNIYAKRYDADTSLWTTVSEIDAGDSGVGKPQVAMIANGSAFAVWVQHDGAYNSIYANRYDAVAGSWGTAEIIDPRDDIIGNEPQVAVDAEGNAIAVWMQSDGTNWSIYANRYDTQSGAWEGAEIIDAGDTQAESVYVAFDADGNAMAVLTQRIGGGYYNMYANRYDALSGAWEGAVLLESGENGAMSPQVDFDADGNAFAVSIQSGTIYANRYDAQSGAWEGAVRLRYGLYGSSTPHLAVGADGNAFAIWPQNDDTGTFWNVYISRYE